MPRSNVEFSLPPNRRLLILDDCSRKYKEKKALITANSAIVHNHKDTTVLAGVLGPDGPSLCWRFRFFGRFQFRHRDSLLYGYFSVCAFVSAYIPAMSCRQLCVCGKPRLRNDLLDALDVKLTHTHTHSCCCQSFS